MEINTEMLKTLYQRTDEYSKARFGEEPDEIHIDEDGQLKLVFISYCYGDRDESCEYVDPEQLTDDLDALVAERLVREENERKARLAQQQREQELREQREKEERKRQYLRLKQEFENK